MIRMKIKKKKIMFKYQFLLILLGCYLSNLTLVKGNNNWLDSATIAYKNTEYSKALIYFQKLESEGINNAELYYNLGNTYYNLGILGQSILYYERALWINPQFKDAQYNLEIAQKFLTDEFEKVPDFNFTVLFYKLNTIVSANFFGYLSIIFLSLTLVLLLLKVSHKYQIKTYLTTILFVLSIVFGLIAIQQVKAIKGWQHAIVIAKNCNVLSAPTDDGKILFNLHEGTKVQVLNTLDMHNFEIKTPNGLIGWVTIDEIELIQIELKTEEIQTPEITNSNF
jgi:tetratricopeptide (TPR) repeat protein